MRPSRLAAALGMALLLCAVRPLPAGAFLPPSAPIAVDAPGGAVLEGSGSDYTLTVPADATLVTFRISFRDLVYNAEPSFALLIRENPDGFLVSVMPGSARLTGDDARTAELTLRANTGEAERVGTLSLTVGYRSADQRPPQSVTIRVVQQAAEAAPAQQAPEPDGAAGSGDLLDLLRDPNYIPDITINGDAATLVYRQYSLISVGPQDEFLRFTINDLTALEADVPLPLDALGEGVVMHAEQVNAVLRAKADDLAAGALADLRFVEAENAYADGALLLESLWPVALPEEAILQLADERFLLLVEDESLLLLVDAEELALGEDVELTFVLRYNGVPASALLPATLPLSNEPLFPVLWALEAGADPAELASSPDDAEADGGSLAAGIGIGSYEAGVLHQHHDGARYIQFMDEIMAFRTSIPNGLVTDEAVLLDIPQELTVTATRDDEPYTFLRGVAVSQPGSYRITVQAAVAAEAEDGGEYALPLVYTAVFRFRILGETVGDLPFYPVPQGFHIASVAARGHPVAEPPARYYHIQADGDYEITLAHDDDPALTHTVRFACKTVPPAVWLVGGMSGQTTRGPVEIVAGEPLAALAVTRDGAAVNVYQNTVSEPGYYTVTATDAAGNAAHLHFRILYSLNLSAWTALALMALLCLGTGGGMFYLRTHMRVR